MSAPPSDMGSAAPARVRLAYGGRGWLRTRIAATVLLGALIVGAGVALLLHNTLAFRTTADTTLREDQYLLHAVTVESLVIDAETGLRGLVITGRSVFLQPLRQAESELPAAIGKLRSSGAQSRIGRAQVNSLVEAIHAYLADYVPRVLALVRSNPSAARSLAVTLEGKRRVDAIRSYADALDRRLSQDGAAREQQARRTATQSVDEAIGVLVLLTLLTVGIGAYLGRLAVERERAREVSEATARTLQESILPPAMPAVPGCELAGRFVPGDGPVSGDFYDAFLVSPDTLAMLIGDVCGKGAPAAAATAMARWTLRGALANGERPASALRLLNDVLLGHVEPRLTTALCMTIKLNGGHAYAEVACAGHPAPVLVHAGGFDGGGGAGGGGGGGAAGPVAAVPASGDLLGAFAQIRVETAEVSLRPGDALVAYTDGVTDRGPGQATGAEDVLARHCGQSAEQLASAVAGLALQSGGRQPDDVAVLALRFLGDGWEQPVAG